MSKQEAERQPALVTRHRLRIMNRDSNGRALREHALRSRACLTDSRHSFASRLRQTALAKLRIERPTTAPTQQIASFAGRSAGHFNSSFPIANPVVYSCHHGGRVAHCQDCYVHFFAHSFAARFRCSLAPIAVAPPGMAEFRAFAEPAGGLTHHGAPVR